ncbi:MAG: sugar-binding protein [Planctomycetales bacterium]|nr:sugar-binding protein [Planctomycetales bacterium]
MARWTSILVFPLLLALVAGCGSQPQAGDASQPADVVPKLAFISNGVADFWTIAEQGATKAGKDLGVDVTVVMPNGMTDQTRKVEDLLTRGIDGIAISPIDSENQIDILNKAASETILITHDSDAPNSNRVMYIGMDNYLAGLMCGELVRKGLPDGGKVMILIGRADQDNAKGRRQGCIDGILGRDPDSSRNDPLGEVLTSEDGKYIVLGTLTDQFDRAKGKANAEDTLTRHPDIAAMVGLFTYNPPLAMEAIDRAGKLGKIKVIAFDEADAVLQGIKDGTVVGTVVQDPYEYGYQSIRVLNELVKENTAVVPPSKFIDIPARVIDQSNVDAFWEDLKEKTGRK